MNSILRMLTGLAVALTATSAHAQEQVFIYNPMAMSGLHIAAPDSHGRWHDLGQVCSSDYGTWGAEKKMYHPTLCRATDGTWRLVFQVNDRSPLFAAAYGHNLNAWRPQDYPRISTRQCLKPVVLPHGDGFRVYFESEQGRRMVDVTADFRHFSADQPADAPDSLWRRDTVEVDRRKLAGQLFSVTPQELELLRINFASRARDGKLSAERMHDDADRYTLLQSPVRATLTVQPDEQKAISDKLIGIFFEDISYAADGGLYAELIQNRDFEYTEKDHQGWNATTAWHSSRPIEIATENPLHPNNPHYAMVGPDTLWNEGWDGIAVEKGSKYDFSMYVRAGGQKQDFDVLLIGQTGITLAKSMLKTRAGEWQQFTAELTATDSDEKARLAIVPLRDARVALDMISLFPQETFKNRKNGLRKDLAETIAALHPKFVRFPGGCMSHGQGLENIYHWQHTVGPLESRKPDFNIWHYHQTRGLGFFEYFQFCEDIGAEPLPVLAAGVPCQNSANNAEGVGGQQGGIPMEEMPAYIDELCNLIDWANADPAANEWAKMRADAGHPAPFNLKYIGIGNEDIISTVFEERYEMICRALRERHPEIKVCGTVGPFHSPSADYEEGWEFTRLNPELQYMVDEHYYESTGWFMNHRDYYDQYDRQSAKVYLGEWAASTKVKLPNVETALAEALYLTDIERNGDIVEMTSYAPMLCKDGHSNWNPDMIYFSNTDIRTTPAYEIQRLFSVYSGDRYVASQLTVDSIVTRQPLDATQPVPTCESLQHRVGASIVADSKSGQRYLKLVNALPVELQVTIDGLQLPQQVKCEQLTGTVEDRNAKAETIETDQPTTLPPYSIRVIEL